MFTLIVAWVGGVLTILSPCILPVLPFVFARADRPFRAHGLPMLLGMAVAFAGIASLAAVGGGWVVAANQTARDAAMALLALFGLSLLFPALADRLSRPLVAVGARLAESHGDERSLLAPVLLGLGTGLLWAPCAGPILGLILTGAALGGASVGSALLLLAYAAGAATSLAVALLFGGRLIRILKVSLPTGDRIRRAAGVAVLLGVGAIASGLDTGALARASIGTTTRLENALVDALGDGRPQRPRGEGRAADAASRRVEAALREPGPPPVSEGMLPSLAGATEWINSPPLTAEGLRGKVVLVDFWTYSCINCLRTLPYVRAWAEKYRDAGLVVIGVHAPEFAFEKSSANVHRATRDLKIDYPVAVDSDFALWRAFGNQYWPAFYFIDAQGRIRHHQFGENDYGRSEQVLRQLLAEAGHADLAPGLVSPQGPGTQAAPGATPARSQESYLGWRQAHDFASPGGFVRDVVHTYRDVPALGSNQWALRGDWTVESERIVLARPGGRIAFRFQARDLHLVLGPGSAGNPVRFRVLVDGKAPAADHGTDVDDQGNGIVDGQRLYQLVRQARGAGERLFDIEFLDPGAQAYVFTFG